MRISVKDEAEEGGGGGRRAGQEAWPHDESPHILASAATSHVHRLVDPYALQPATLCSVLRWVLRPRTSAAERRGEGEEKE